MFVYDQLDILTFTNSASAVVDELSFKTDNVDGSGKATDVLDLEAVIPNRIGQSVYIVPRVDSDGALPGGTGTTKINAELKSGASDSPDKLHGTARQVENGEMLEIPIAKTCLRYIQVLIKSDGGGSAHSLTKGGVQVFIGKSGL